MYRDIRQLSNLHYNLIVKEILLGNNTGFGLQKAITQKSRPITKQGFYKIKQWLIKNGILLETKNERGRGKNTQYYSISSQGLINYLIENILCDSYLVPYIYLIDYKKELFDIGNKDFLSHINELLLKIYTQETPTLLIVFTALINLTAQECEPEINKFWYNPKYRKDIIKKYNIRFKKTEKAKPATQLDLIILMIDVFNDNLNTAFNIIYRKHRRFNKKFVYTQLIFSLLCLTKHIEAGTGKETMLLSWPFSEFPK